MHIYNCNSVNYFFLLVRFSNRGSVRFLNLIIHYVNGEIFGTEKTWSVFRDGPLCEAVRYRVSIRNDHTYRNESNSAVSLRVMCWKNKSIMTIFFSNLTNLYELCPSLVFYRIPINRVPPVRPEQNNYLSCKPIDSVLI